MIKRFYSSSNKVLNFKFVQNDQDFIVTELPIRFSGHGNFIIFKVEKSNMDTWELIDRLCDYLGIYSNEIGYAGLKDKRATTTQYLSIPKKYSKEMKAFRSSKIKILDSTLHNQKLNIGDLEGNRFKINLHDVEIEELNQIQKIIKKISKKGMPNYFGYQRFGKEVEESSLPSSIKSMNREGATLEDGTIITRDGVSKFKLPKDFQFLNVSNTGKVLATNYKDKLLIGNEELDIGNVVVAASLKDNKLALIYSNNSIELLDIDTKKTLFKEYMSISLANDTRIANPHFMGNLLLFPTLNGKVLIVSTKTNESVKNISVDLDSEFNNIIFLKVVQDKQTLIAATANKVVTISTKNIVSKDYEIRDIINNGESIYLATIDGRIIKLNLALEEIASKKYKYSKIYALTYTDSLYAIESQNFIINIDNDFTNDKIYHFDFDNEERLIVINNKVYTETRKITLP